MKQVYGDSRRHPRLGEGILQPPFPKLRGNRQNAPSPDWGRLGWGVSRKGFVLSSLRLEAMRERQRAKPVRWRKTMSFPTARIIQIRHGVPCFNRKCVTPAHEPVSPANTDGFKLFRPLQFVQLCDSESSSE